MSTHAVYVLETRWAWDNSNTEYATITIEVPDTGFEALLSEDTDLVTKEALINLLERIAEAQNGNLMASEIELVRLYRIEGADGYKWVQRQEHGNGKVTLTIEMTPVCSFENNKPVPFVP